MSAAAEDIGAVYRYHDGTKHHFDRFARSLGFLDWASQPRPCRSFLGAPSVALFLSPASSPGYEPRQVGYRQISERPDRPAPWGAGAIGDLLRHSLGLSAWKQAGASRWALRVNPSSGNLHPTEAYIVCGSSAGLAVTPAVYHYAADRHALEERCAFDREAWASVNAGEADVLLVALTSIHWREAWKYGERAFRYCQHDLGHAIAAVAAGDGNTGVASDSPAGVVASRHCRTHGRRAGRGLRRGRAGRARLPHGSHAGRRTRGSLERSRRVCGRGTSRSLVGSSESTE